MKRALIVATIVGGLFFGGAGAAIANGHGGGPPFGPDGVNPTHPAWYGLCTAYARNADQAKENGAPFQAMEKHFEENDTNFEEFCGDRTPGNSGNTTPGSPGSQGNRP